MSKPKIGVEKRLGENQMVQEQEMHCAGCGRFLGYQAIVWGIVKIKCPNCKEFNTIDISPEHMYDNNGR